MPDRRTFQGKLGERRSELTRAAVLLIGIWILGLGAVGAIAHFEGRVDASRHAQVVIAQMRNQEGLVLAAAFDPAVAATRAAPSRELTIARVNAAKNAFRVSVSTLRDLGGSNAARVEQLTEKYFTLIDRISLLVGRGATTQAALELGKSQRPDGVRALLTHEFDRADASYSTAAARSRMISVSATVVAIVLLLVAFSIAFQHLVRARWRSHRDATTDELTGLGNRRRLFGAMERRLATVADDQTVTIGIFDLDGFKAYNDTFGHPAGDALLARLGSRLAVAVGGLGQAYRIGGDEFVVVTEHADYEALMDASRSALSEHGGAFAIGCSVGSARIRSGITLEHALHIADQRLYTNKRSAQRLGRFEVKDALLRVLAEQNTSLVTHLGQVADLAADTATAYGLSPDDVQLTRLAAELHDVGKVAIPASILDKPGPLDSDEWEFLQRHSAIGERIVAAAPTLEAIAPIIRASHERVDGTGYPDGLPLTAIPIASRIIAVVDAYDAMTTGRPYREKITRPEAFAELQRHAGTQFDPSVVEVFASVIFTGSTTLDPWGRETAIVRNHRIADAAASTEARSRKSTLRV